MNGKSIFFVGVIILLLGIIAYLLIIVSEQKPKTNHFFATSTTSSSSAPAHDISAVSVLSKKISVTSPAPHSSVDSHFIVEGQAPGSWYFEAVFPIQIRDSHNDVIGHASARAQSDWQTSKLVSFVAPVSIDNYHGPATIILLRDNPSGLPENDDSISIPIIIK